METEVSCDLRFFFLTRRLPRPFCCFKKFEFARNRNMLSLLKTYSSKKVCANGKGKRNALGFYWYIFLVVS